MVRQSSVADSQVRRLIRPVGIAWDRCLASSHERLSERCLKHPSQASSLEALEPGILTTLPSQALLLLRALRRRVPHHGHSIILEQADKPSPRLQKKAKEAPEIGISADSPNPGIACDKGLVEAKSSATPNDLATVQWACSR